ncbi:hypothetical protein CKA32_005795 [Geitlerinema sp. FC II]|nr:hypothetical protein CKA32_005795 [Geitlerinema sp. FC II]
MNFRSGVLSVILSFANFKTDRNLGAVLENLLWLNFKISNLFSF